MESKNGATSRKKKGRRGSLFRSSSTGTGMDASAAAQLQGKKVSIDKAFLVYAAMDDIGVSGVKSRVPGNRRGSAVEDGSSSRSSDSKKMWRDKSRMVIAGGIQGIQETAGDIATQIKDIGITGALSSFAMKSISFDRRAAWNARVTSLKMRVGITVECHNLPKQTALRPVRSFCVLWEVPNGYTGGKGSMPCSLPGKQEHEIGRSRVVLDNPNPLFSEKFYVDYQFNVEQSYMVRIYDQDLAHSTDLKEHGYIASTDLKEHDYIAGFVFQLGDLLGRPAQKLVAPLHLENGDAKLILSGRELGSSREFLKLRIGAEGLAISDSLWLSGTSGPFFRLERLTDDANLTWQPIWQSEVLLTHDNTPTWAEVCLSLLEMCGGDSNAAIKVTFWESHSRDNEYLGHVMTTVEELITKGSQVKRTPIYNHKKHFFGTKTKVCRAGEMHVLHGRRVHRPGLLQYLDGGCEIDLILAVDCGDYVNHDDKEEAHHFHHGSWYNNYQMAIEKVGAIMEPYSRNNYFHMWGYNARASMEQTDNVFEMGKKITGKQGLLSTYDNTLRQGNRLLARQTESQLGSLINMAMFRSIKEAETRHCYSILCILTPGKVNDLQALSEAVHRAATDAPLSIIFIGCGESGMDGIKNHFEKHKVQRSIMGVKLSRENTSFASFAEAGGNTSKVVEEALKDIPEQILQMFNQAGIDPKPAPKIDPETIHNIHLDMTHRHRHKKHPSKSPERSRHKHHHSKSPVKSPATSPERNLHHRQQQSRSSEPSPKQHRQHHSKSPVKSPATSPVRNLHHRQQQSRSSEPSPEHSRHRQHHSKSPVNSPARSPERKSY